MDAMDDALGAAVPADPIAQAEAVVTVTIDYVTERTSVYRPVWLARRRTEHVWNEGVSLSERAADMQRAALRAAIEAKLLRADLDPDLLGMQIFEGWVRAADLWAENELDATQFKAKALYTLYVALLASAAQATRPMLLDKLRTVEQALRLGMKTRRGLDPAPHRF